MNFMVDIFGVGIAFLKPMEWWRKWRKEKKVIWLHRIFLLMITSSYSWSFSSEGLILIFQVFNAVHRACKWVLSECLGLLIKGEEYQSEWRQYHPVFLFIYRTRDHVIWNVIHSRRKKRNGVCFCCHTDRIVMIIVIFYGTCRRDLGIEKKLFSRKIGYFSQK